MFTDFYEGQYAPFLELTTLILYTIDQYNPFIFHLTSLLWHIGNVWLVWLFVKRLLRAKYGSTSTQNVSLPAFLTALLFAIHPVNVESVAWLSAMKILIYAFFFSLGLLCYLRYINTQKGTDFLKTIFCFLFSFWGKEQSVTFPLMLILIDWFLRRDMKSYKVWLEKISFFSMASLFGIVTVFSQGYGQDPNTYPFIQRTIFAGYAIFEYISKSIIPVKLNFLYPFPMLPGETLPMRFLIYPVLILGLATWIYMYRKKTMLIFWTFFFCINLLFSIHLIPMSRNTIVADRYLYLSVAAVMFAFAWGLTGLKKIYGERKRYLISVSGRLP